MKKLVYMVVLTCFCIVNTVNAQSTFSLEKKDTIRRIVPTGYIELSFGMAIPTGRFANKSGAGYGGYTSLGNNANISLAIPIHHSNFGVAFMYGSFSNYFDLDTYVSNMQATDLSKTYWPIKGDEYDESFIMGGLFATYPIHHFSFDFRFMGGVALCYLPEINYGASITPEGYYNYEWNTYASKSSSFAYDAGADIRYRIRRMGLMIGVDFISTDPNVSTTEQYTYAGGNYSYTHIAENLPIKIVSVDFGVSYRIK